MTPILKPDMIKNTVDQPENKLKVQQFKLSNTEVKKAPVINV